MFCADPLWQWLGPPPAALRYVIYFRFMDDVTFGRSGLYGASGVVTPGRSLMSMNVLLIYWAILLLLLQLLRATIRVAGFPFVVCRKDVECRRNPESLSETTRIHDSQFRRASSHINVLNMRKNSSEPLDLWLVHSADKTVLSRPRWLCEQAITCPLQEECIPLSLEYATVLFPYFVFHLPLPLLFSVQSLVRLYARRNKPCTHTVNTSHTFRHFLPTHWHSVLILMELTLNILVINNC